MVLKYHNHPWGRALLVGPFGVCVFKWPHPGIVLGWNEHRSRAVFLR